MRIPKTQTAEKSTFIVATNFLTLDKALLRQFDKMAFALLLNKKRDLPDRVQEFIRLLIARTEPGELLHLAQLHNQRALYNTLKEVIRLQIREGSLPEEVMSAFVEIAAQFFTQAYCIYHEPNNRSHRNNYWAYRLSLDLMAALSPIHGAEAIIPGSNDERTV